MATRKAVAPPPPPPGFEIIPASVPPPPPGFELIDGATPVNPYQHPGGAKPAPYRTIKEREDAAIEAIPPALAVVATLPVSGPAAFGGLALRGFGGLVRAALARAGTAAVAGGVGSALASNVQLMRDTPNKPKDSREIVTRALSSAAFEGGTQLGSEVVGAIPGALMAGAGRIVKAAPKSTGGQRFFRAKWDALAKAQDATREAKSEAANEIVNTLSAHAEPHEVGEIGADAVKKFFDDTFRAKEREQYVAFQDALKGSKIDYTDVAYDLIALENARPKAKGGLSKFTEADAEWADLIDRMRKGQKAKVVPTDKGASRVTGVLGEELAPERVGKFRIEPAPNAVERGDAVVVARSAVSQRLHDVRSTGGYTREYVEGLERTLSALDRKIKDAAFDVDPVLAAGYSELLKFSGSRREMLKQAFVQMASKRQGDLAKNLLVAGHPEWVNTFRTMMAEGAVSPADFAKVQRAGVESLLLRTKGTGEKVLDLENFATRLDATGAAGRRLFSDPNAKRLVDNLREMSLELKAMPKTPQQAGIPYTGTVESKLGEIAASAVGFKLTNIVFLPREAYAMMNKAIVKVADNPQAYRKLMAAVRAAKTAGKVSPTAANLAADAFRTANVYDSVKGLFEPQMAPAHEVQR
jgi:hypothetical protein